jgi:hypothetical protein
MESIASPFLLVNCLLIILNLNAIIFFTFFILRYHKKISILEINRIFNFLNLTKIKGKVK